MRARTSAPMVLLSLLVVGVLAGSVSAAPVNLLANPGFETGDFTGWTVHEGPTAPDSTYYGERGYVVIPNVTADTGYTTHIRTGTYAMIGHVRYGNSVFISQRVPVLPNQNVDVGFWVGRGEDGTGFGVTYGNESPRYTQIYVDGERVLFPGPTINVSAKNTYYHLGTSFNTGDREYVDVLFRLEGSGSAWANVMWDDFYFNSEPVPEPATMGLFAAGLCVCLRRRRR